MNDENYFAPGSMAVSVIESPKFNEDVIEETRALLESHGAHIEERETSCIILLPPGTTKTEIYPRIHFSKYRITLPDGFIFYENELVTTLSLVRLPLDLFSEEIQMKYRR